MSKKMSKVLLVLVLAVVMATMCALVACGDDKNKGTTEPTGPEAMDKATAMADMQTAFNDAETKSVTENINISGIYVNVQLIQLKINNVDIELVRTYDASKNLNLKAKIKNIQVKIPKGLDTIKGFIPAKGIEIWKNDKLVDTIPQSAINELLDNDVLAKLANVELVAEVDITPAMVVTVKDFTVNGMDKVTNADDQPLELFTKYDLNVASYPVDALIGGVVDPRHEADPDKAGDKAGIFNQMDEYCNNLEGGTAGTELETFLTTKYQMMTLYNFGELDESTTTGIKSNKAADLSEILGIAQSTLDAYSTNVIKGTTTVGSLLEDTFETKNVKSIISKLLDLGNAEMTGTLKVEDDTLKLDTMTTKQNVTLHISGAMIQKLVTVTLPGLIDNFPDLSQFGPVLDVVFEKGINSDIKAVTTSKFVY